MSTKTDASQQKDATHTKDPMERLEEALVCCGFGKFHVRLLAATMCSVFAAMIITTTSSYILSVAECDLDMNIIQKGVLNSMPFFGQVGASLFTGFLIDVFGRRVFLVGGNAAIFILTIMEGSCQTYWMLLFIKLLQGIALSLSWSAIIPLLTELISKNVRDRVLFFTASFVSLSLIVAALQAWVMLPIKIDLVILKGCFKLHAWNFYLYACSIWSLSAALLYYSLPESPKYLLSHGREAEALEILSVIYKQNNGNSVKEFTTTALNQCKTKTLGRGLKEQLVLATHDVKELFRRPLLTRLLLITFITFICLLTYTSLRLWFPHLSTVIEDYQKVNNETAEFCVMISNSRSKPSADSVLYNSTEPSICVPKVSESQTYINGILMGAVSLAFVCIGASVVDFLGQKPLMLITLLLCCACSSSVYWATSSLQIALLISATCASMQSFLSFQQNVLVRIFPTTVRALALSIIVMMGRVGSLLGSILFPVLLEMGCMAPFLSLSAVSLCVACLIFLLPNPNKENNGVGDR